MKNLVFLLLTISALNSTFSQNEEETYGIHRRFSVGLGVYLAGPYFNIGSSIGSNHTELTIYFHAIDWEKNEQLLNKPTSGGALVAFNYFPGYSGSLKSSRFKWLIGLGSGFEYERAGNNSGYNNLEGEWKYWEAHIGSRYFITELLSITAWVGYAFSIDDSQSILKKYPELGWGVEEKMVPLALMLSAEFSL